MFFQVFHVCDSGRKVSFLCPNGTIFRQSHLICDWWFRVECERSPELYEQSVQQLQADQNVYKQRAETISNAMQSALSKGVKDTVMLESPVSVTNKLNDEFNSESDLPSARPEQIFTAGTTPPQTPRTTTPFNPSDFTQFNADFTKTVNSLHSESSNGNFDASYFNSATSPRFGFNTQSFATPSTNSQYYTPATPPRVSFNQPTPGTNNLNSVPSQSQPNPNNFNRVGQNSNFAQNANAGSTFSRANTNTDFNSFNSNPSPSSGFDFNSNPSFTSSPPRSNFDQNTNPPPSTGVAFSNLNPPSFNSQSRVNYDQSSNLQKQAQNQNYPPQSQQKPAQNPSFNSPSRVNFDQSSNVQITNYSPPPQVNFDQNNVQNANYSPPPRANFEQNSNVQSTNYSPPPRVNYDQSSNLQSKQTSPRTFNPNANVNPQSSGAFSNSVPGRGNFNSGSFAPSPKPPSLNSISPLRNSFTSEQKTTPSKLSAASPSRNSVNPLRVTGSYSPTFGSTFTSPRSTVSVTVPPKSSYSTPASPTLPARTPPRTSYSPTATPTTRQLTSAAPVTLSQNNVFSNANRPTTRFQQPQTFPPFTTTSPTTNVDYFREQQILAETAAFAGNGKYQFQNFYYPQNFVAPPSSKGKFNEATTAPPPDTTQFVDFTTINPFNSIFNSNSQNDTNDSYALYYPSEDNAVNLLNLITTTEGTTDPAKTNASKPSVSEFLLSSFSTEPQPGATTDEPTGQTIPILLTNQTREGYDQLFPRESSTSKSSDLRTEFSNGLVQSSSPKTLPSAESLNEKLKFKSSPDFRELAQIFSRALSAYLEDPEQFRKILSEVRPTEPPSIDGPKSERDRPEDEVLAFSEDERTSSRPTTLSSSSAPTIRNPETFAEEINNFMIDPFAGHTDSGDFNVNETYYPSTVFNNGTTAVTFTVSPVVDFTLSSTPLSTLPATLADTKANLYEDKDTSKFSDSNAQSLQEAEPLLITADTQSFVAPDNLVRYPNFNQYNLPAPSLKSPAYPQFGMRTTASPAYISSRADAQTTQTYQAAAATTYETSRSYDDNWLQSTSNALTPLFNESAVRAVMNMMEEAKTNAALRNKLVLLLVTDRDRDRGQLENDSVKDMKSKLLKALLVPPTTRPYDRGFTEPASVPVSRRKVRKEGRVSVRRHSWSTPTPATPATRLYRPTDSSKSTDDVISRTGRSTMRPSQQVEADGLSDTDTRAVDLLKTLYSLASGNWNR